MGVVFGLSTHCNIAVVVVFDDDKVITGGFTCPPTIYFKFTTKCDKCYYKVRQLFYYKARQVLLKSATGITKCDNFITKCDRYYKVRRLFQSATEPT